MSTDQAEATAARRAPVPVTPSTHAVTDTPDWYKRAVFYEVLVRSFKDSDGDGVGDLKGLTSKLDYLQWLGVDCLWLPPFFQSPLRDGGYDVSDYRAVQPEFGTLDDFRDQLKTVRKMGPLSSLVSMLPGMAQVRQADLDEDAVVRVMAILDSMTPKERERPEILNGSRKRRIARGSGQGVPEINRLLKQFAQMRKVMKTLQAARPGKGGKGGLKLPFLGR